MFTVQVTRSKMYHTTRQVRLVNGETVSVPDVIWRDEVTTEYVDDVKPLTDDPQVVAIKLLKEFD